MRWDQVRKGKSVNNQCKYFEIQANSTLLLSSTILVTSAMYFTPSMARISSGQRPESSWSSSCRNKKIRWDGILQLSYPFYLCVWTEAWCKVDYPTAVKVAMQLAAWLVIRLVDSAEPIPPELSPTVPIVRPVVVLAAQVTIVITATVLSRISEIFWKNIRMEKKFLVWYVIFFCLCMDRWTDNWLFLWWMILAVMSIVGNNSWELPRTGQSFTHQRQQTFIVPVMKVWSSFKTFEFSIPPSLNSNSCLKFKVNRLSSLEMHSSFYLVWFAFYNLWTDVQTYKEDSLK